MMKTRYCLIAMAAMGLLAGCSKEIQNSENTAPSGEKFRLTVGLDEQVKTYMGESDGTSRKIYWADGDAIDINGMASEALSGVEENTTSAVFSWDEAPAGDLFNVLYPASIRKDDNSVTLPAFQDYKKGGFANNMFPMACQTTDLSSLSLSSLCSVIKVAITRSSEDGADTDKIIAVRFAGKSAEKVNGTFTIDYEAPALAEETTTVADEMEVRVTEGLATSTTEAVEYYLVVPARTYENGFYVTVQDTEGHTMKLAHNASKTLDKGTLYTMNCIFAPSGEESGIEISSAEELAAFASAFNNGDYDDLEGGLVVSLTGDISFNEGSMADFMATGGIGTADDGTGGTRYFNGVFNGGGHTISNFVGNVPLVAYTGDGGLVENINLDSSCALTITSGAHDTHHGAFVGRHKGTLKDCTSAANLTISNLEDVESAIHYYGGLVGRIYGGSVSGCTNTGDIVCSQSGITITENNVYIGGIAGYLQVDGAGIYDSAFKGNITVSDGSTYGGITAAKKYFYIGGIVGYTGNDITIDNCNASETGGGKSIDLRGTMVPGVGGIAGWVSTNTATISNCNNHMSISFASDGARANITPTRIGGIAGRSQGQVSACSNYAAISTVCNSTSIFLGGILGDGSNVSDCNNYEGGTLTRTNQLDGGQTNRYIFMGGILGAMIAAGDISRCNNYAAVTCNQPGTSSNTTIDMGGILGAGYDGGDPWQVDLSDCSNSGNITATDANAYIFNRISMGGIAGYVPGANSTIKGNCRNSGQVYLDFRTANKNGRASYIGGIAGVMGVASTSAVTGVEGLEISNCHNTGAVYTRNYNNTVTTLPGTAFSGGIVGAVVGTSTGNALIKENTAGPFTQTTYRGLSGGIAGYAEQTALTDNTASQTMTGNNNAEGYGGIVGWSVASSLSGCTFAGTINTVKNIGGLIYLMDGGSMIQGCKVEGATFTKGTNAAATDPAVLVSTAKENATIRDCGVKGTIGGVAITLDSNMITSDEGADISGTYLIE